MLELRLAESSVAAADENMRSSRARDRVGMDNLSDLLQAQTMWRQARQTLVEARVDRYLR